MRTLETSTRLLLPDGLLLRVSTYGVWIGRSPQCDLVVSDPKVSRVHAVVRVLDGNTWAFGLGGRGFHVNGHRVDRVALEHGDRVVIGDLELQICVARSGQVDVGGHWIVASELSWVRVNGHLTVGGGADDDLRVEHLPAGAASFRVLRGGLLVELGIAAKVNGEVVGSGKHASVRHGQAVQIGDTRLTVLREAANDAVSTEDADQDLPTVLSFAFLASGGVLAVTYPTETIEVALTELRGRLVATLVDPPGELGCGDWISDDEIIRLVWPRSPSVRVGQLNQLLHRVRTDLIDAGIDGYVVLERLKGGGAIRARIRDGR